MQNKLIKPAFIYPAVFVLFLILGIIAGIHHEPWADEAQSWLIARDNNTFINICRAVRYEATLPTWSLILKLFQIAGVDYAHIYIVPLFFSAAGVILLFFCDVPLYVKILLPFSFYTVYQNAVVARQYALVFPVMMLIFLSYKERQKKPLRYCITLVLLGLTSSYGIIVSGSFMLWDLICMLRKKTIKSYDLKFKALFLATALIMALMLVAVIPPADTNFGTLNMPIADSFSTTFLFHADNVILQYLLSFVIAALLIWYFRRDLFQFAVITLPVIIYMTVFYHRLWHTTYLFYLVIILMMILRKTPEPENGNDKHINYQLPDIFVCLLLIVQFSAGFYSIRTDILHPYYSSENVAKYISPLVGKGSAISFNSFSAIGIQPYFRSNIFANYHSDKAYMIWNNAHSTDRIITDGTDVIITGEKLGSNLDLTGWKLHTFPSTMIFKFSPAEDSTMYVYIREDAVPKE